MPRILYLDQNQWVALARGAWDKEAHPAEHDALVKIARLVEAGEIMVPLTFSNFYETAKINTPERRFSIASPQAVISRGRVFRGRRRILSETLAAYLASTASVSRPELAPDWFLSSLWFEAAGDDAIKSLGSAVSDRVMRSILQQPERALLHYLCGNDEAVRMDAVRCFSAGAGAHLARMEARRARVAGESFAVRQRAYRAQLLLDEIDFVLVTARNLGLPWATVSDIGAALARSIMTDVPVLNIECELAVRLEDQRRPLSENDLRDMMSFIAVLPFADIVVAEKQFVNLSRQAGLDRRYAARLLTSLSELTDYLG